MRSTPQAFHPLATNIVVDGIINESIEVLGGVEKDVQRATTSVFDKVPDGAFVTHLEDVGP